MCDVIGKAAGFKEILCNPNVKPAVKMAVQTLQTMHANIVSTCAHRTTLRHETRGYCHLFGVPLVFTTLNVADTRDFVVNLMYNDEPLYAWRVMDEHAPKMPSVGKMNENQAADPAVVARFFDLKMRSFMKLSLIHI